MAMSERVRRKHAQAAQKLLPDAVVTGYAVGRAGTDPALVVVALICTVVLVSGGLAVITGVFVLPGVVPVFLVHHVISPPRAVVITDRGVALAKRSVWTGKPKKLVTVMGHGYVRPVGESFGRRKVHVGPESVWMVAKEEAIVRTAIGRQVTFGGPFPPSPFRR